MKAESGWSEGPARDRLRARWHGRRQASPLREQFGDEARVGATLAVAHPESGTASLPSRGVASHALAASRTDPNEAIGKPAWAATGMEATTGMGDGKRRPYGGNSALKKTLFKSKVYSKSE